MAAALLLAWLGLAVGAAQGVGDVRYIPGSSQKLEQYLGDTDFQTGQPTLSLTSTRFHLDDSDLGVSFRHKGLTYVAFGDSNFPGAADSMATTADTDPESGLTLDFLSKSGSFSRVTIPGISLGGFDVPIFGVSSAGKLFLYYSTDADPSVPVMGRTVVAVSTNDAVTWSAPLYTLSSNRFINVSLHRVNTAELAGLPLTNGPGFLIFGSGFYRRSDVYLAFQPESGITDPATLRYFAGLTAGGAPTWSAREADAAACIPTARTNANGQVVGVGELSATYNMFLGKWMVLFNLGGQIHAHTADAPWGPYSPSLVSFDPVRDHAAGAYIYYPGLNDTNLCQPNLPGHDTTAPGGVYGPYVFGAFTRGRAAADGGFESTMYHSMSTWKPYNAVLMRTQFRRAAPPWILAAPRATNFVTTAAAGGADAYVQSGTNAASNFGGAKVLTAKNPGPEPGNVARKVYLRFLPSLGARDLVVGAELALTVAADSTVTNTLTYNVYGLLTGSDGWTEPGITWTNAPGNDAGDSEGVDGMATTLLGTMVTTNHTAGTTATLSSWALREFLQRHRGGSVTLIVTRLTPGAGVEAFASRESTNQAPPTLTIVSGARPVDAILEPGAPSFVIPLHLETTSTNATLQAVSSDPLLLPAGAVSVTGSGTNFTVTLNPAPGRTGRATVTLSSASSAAAPDATSFDVLVYPRPALTASRTAGNELGLVVSGAQGPTYALESSADLVNWRPVVATNPPALPWSVTASIGGATQFYRVALAP